MINPTKLLQIRSLKQKFDSNHPKFSRFVKAASQSAMREGSVIEISVTTPEGKSICSNLKVQKSDLELFDTLQELMNHSQDR